MSVNNKKDRKDTRKRGFKRGVERGVKRAIEVFEGKGSLPTAARKVMEDLGKKRKK